jgi:glycogen synthase
MPGREKADWLKLLVISNLYPPNHLGGYELGCADIVDALRRRGHEVTVLTTRHGLEAPQVEGDVHRCLSFRPDQTDRSLAVTFRREREDQQKLARLIAVMQPDLLYVFSLYGASTALLLTAQRTGRPVVYAFSAEWLEPQYRGDPWLGLWSHCASSRPRRALKWLVRRFVDPLVPTGLDQLDLRHAYFASRRLRELFTAKGFPAEMAEVIHWGVDPTQFHPVPRRDEGSSLRLLFAGRIVRQKGLHTVVEALGLLRGKDGIEGISLTVAGPIQDAEYLSAIRSQAEQSGILSRMRFLGPIPREAMPELYRNHEVYLLPSIWEEPFSIGLVEAMASGLAVIGTRAGGSLEILRDRENSLVYSPGDARELANHLRSLQARELRNRLGEAARRTAESGFRFQDMVVRIEAFLRRAVGDAGE